VMCSVLLAAGLSFGQYTNKFGINAGSTEDVKITHKAYSQAFWLADLGGSEVTNHLPITCGLKQSKTDNTFYALSTGTVVSASAGTVLFTFPASSFATNLSANATLYGDIRLTNYDQPLPSLLVTLKPSYNWGSETYVSPQNHEYQTNGVSIGTKRIINFSDGFDASATATTLTLGISSSAQETLQSVTDRGAVTTNAITVPSVSIVSGTYTSTVTFNDDEATQSLEFTHPDGGTVTINGETFRMWKNSDSVAITNGQPVCLYAGAGGVGRVVLADADDPTRNCVIGVFTGESPLEPDSIGRVTRFGAVKSFDLDAICPAGFAEGSMLYLSTVKGQYVTNKLAAPVDAVLVGVVSYKSPAANDTIEVSISASKNWSELDTRYYAITNSFGAVAYADWTQPSAGTWDLQGDTITNLWGLTYGQPAPAPYAFIYTRSQSLGLSSVTVPPTGGNAGILCASTNSAGINNGALILYGKAIRIGPSMTNVNFSTATVSASTPTATNHVATKAYVDAADLALVKTNDSRNVALTGSLGVGGAATFDSSVTAASYATTGNRTAIGAATQIGTNATYTISYANGYEQMFGFSSTNDLTIALTSPGAGYRSQVDCTFTNYSYRAVTWPSAANYAWINAAPTGDYARVLIDFDGTNVSLINKTWNGQ